MTTLSELAKQTETQRHDAFIIAAWKNESADELLRLARDAGIHIEQADRILVRIANAQKLLPKLDSLPRLREAAADALGHLEEVGREHKKVIEKLQAVFNSAATVARAAQLELNDAESVTREFYQLQADGLLPAIVAPVEIQRQIAREKAGVIVQRREAELVALNNRRRDVARRLESLESRRVNPLLHVPEREALERDIDAAKAELDAADRAVEVATEAVADARAEVPA